MLSMGPVVALEWVIGLQGNSIQKELNRILEKGTITYNESMEYKFEVLTTSFDTGR